uniref:Uncharacterized protein n=1 Tax=Lepeophtheirus salmonis TaxID=72036 RepID=A0A0K2U0G3_LEPSM
MILVTSRNCHHPLSVHARGLIIVTVVRAISLAYSDRTRLIYFKVFRKRSHLRKIFFFNSVVFSCLCSQLYFQDLLGYFRNHFSDFLNHYLVQL